MLDRRLRCALAACASVLALAATALAETPRTKGATSGRAARREAIAAMPLDRLAPQDREAVQRVLDDTSLYRRMPEQVIRCDPALFEMLINHPDVTVSLFRELDISRLSVERTGDETFRGDDTHGTRGELRYVWRSPEAYLVYGDGGYEGPLLKNRVRGQCVVLMRVRTLQEDGQWYVTAQLDTFLRLEQVGADLVARTFQPVVGRIIDANFLEAMKFASSLSRAAEVNPASTQALVDRLTRVTPQDQQQLRDVLGAIGQGTAVAMDDPPPVRQARAPGEERQ